MLHSDPRNGVFPVCLVSEQGEKGTLRLKKTSNAHRHSTTSGQTLQQLQVKPWKKIRFPPMSG